MTPNETILQTTTLQGGNVKERLEMWVVRLARIALGYRALAWTIQLGADRKALH
jgi:hypothetical protein